MKKISIVISCYNRFSLMKKCLNSLENQTSQDFEVIIVDDCSNDNSYQKLLEYGKKTKLDLHILKTKENIGPGGTRNLGIKEANGRYIMMLDSDDYLELNSIEKLIDIITEKKVECIFFDYYLDYKNKLVKKNTVDYLAEGYIEGKEALIYSSGSACGKLFLLDIIKKNNIYYPKLMRNEDMPFNKITISYCKDFYYLKSPLYHYVVNKDSLTHNEKYLNENNAIIAFEYIKENIDNIKFHYELEAIFIKEYLYSTTMTKLEKKYTCKKLKKYIIEIEKMYPKWYKNDSISKYPIHIKLCLSMIRYRCIFMLKLLEKAKKIYKKIKES